MNNSSLKKSHQRSGFLEHTLHEISSSLERTFFAEEISNYPGLLQSLDARVKVIGFLGWLIAVSYSRSLWVIAAIYGLAVILSWLSAVPMKVFILRVWLTLPFFTGLIIIPAIFITPGPVLFSLPFGLVVTQTGVTSALFLLLRVTTSVSLSLLLILTTSWNRVLGALSVLRVPDGMILILGMTYRYIFLLLHIANDMFMSRQSRKVGVMTGAENRRMMAAISGTLLSKSLKMSDDVFLAMQSRGFRGTVIPLRQFTMHNKDWLGLILFLLITVLAMYFGHG